MLKFPFHTNGREGKCNGEDSPSFARERNRMVDDQVAARGIADSRVLDAMRRVPRHLFVEEALQSRAYGDHPLPIGEGQTISQPFIVALTCQALALNGAERVLEIGTGSGYQTAILAELAEKVYSIERLNSLASAARARLDRLGYHDVACRISDGSLGWSSEAPFDGIAVAASAPEIPPPLKDQVGEGGRLVLPVGDPEDQVLLRVTRTGDLYESVTLSPCVFVRLVGRHGWTSGD